MLLTGFLLGVTAGIVVLLHYAGGIAVGPLSEADKVMCAEAGGHEIDLLVLHHCQLDNGTLRSCGGQSAPGAVRIRWMPGRCTLQCLVLG